MGQLEKLCSELLEARKDEARATGARIAIEADIIRIVGNKPEGSQTTEAEGFKVTTTGKITRSMNWSQWDLVKDQIPELLRPVKMKPELDTVGVKYLQANEPAIYALLPIEVKPAKTSVEVKAVELEAA